MSETKNLYQISSESHSLTEQLGSKIQSFLEDYINLKSNWSSFEDESIREEKIAQIHNSLTAINNLIGNLKELLTKIEEMKKKNVESKINIDELTELRHNLLEQSKEKARKIDSLITSLQSLDREIQTYFTLKENS
ncbi:hypothetical protein BCR32DRAFT_269089 [Anaeromyces robustus]|uniref:Uncharacterized protein n=1 Tax=Anaeromyces robustus TaxID=1754192 RepID=A0A1Y1X321_9FUNG|nr:hypothetical protein BCR32DRAFT_269089 [Anaeromyces robustus]|eukprot:ORX80028.1 hypothetical protein BCR32DRAFT_269089 [Anaeromyces robustus]